MKRHSFLGRGRWGTNPKLGFDEASLARLRGSWVIHSPHPMLRSSSVEGEGGEHRGVVDEMGVVKPDRAGEMMGNGDEIWQEKKNYQYLNLP